MARASFTTLPLELKARIAEMTSYQEEMWLQRVTDPDERAGHMSSLSSLALVNKEFRELAAKHQFRVLSSNRASMPVFRFSILQRYGHHVESILFYAPISEELEGSLE